MRLAPIVLALFATPAFAVDIVETCHWESKALFKADRPKAKATTIKPALTAAKPKRVKLMKPVPRDGFDWICDDDETIVAAPLERIAAVPMPEEAEPVALTPIPSVLPAMPPADEPFSPPLAPPDDVYAAGPAPIPGPWGVGIGGGGGFAPCDCAPPPCPIPAVPEPSTWALMLAGALVLVAARRTSAGAQV